MYDWIYLIDFVLFFGNITAAIMYQVKNEYQKATYHSIWAILIYMIIHDVVGG